MPDEIKNLNKFGTKYPSKKLIERGQIGGTRGRGEHYPIRPEDWKVIHRVLSALGYNNTWKNETGFYEAIDFFRKILVLCCAFVGGSDTTSASAVSRPMFAAFVSLMFAFMHIRVWPYRRKETNIHKMISDFTICFVFYLCSIKAAGQPHDFVFQMLELSILFMWRVLVPLSLLYSIWAGIRRERWELKTQLRRECEEGGQLMALPDATRSRILKQVSSLDALKRLDEAPSWLHRRIFSLRRPSSLREQLLCTCHLEGLDPAECVNSPAMKCSSSNEFMMLQACRRIPYVVQERLDKSDFADSDREILRMSVRTMDKLASLRDQQQLVSFCETAGLSAQAQEKLRDTVAMEEQHQRWQRMCELGQRVTACCCCCCSYGCARASQQDASSSGNTAGSSRTKNSGVTGLGEPLIPLSLASSDAPTSAYPTEELPAIPMPNPHCGLVEASTDPHNSVPDSALQLQPQPQPQPQPQSLETFEMPSPFVHRQQTIPSDVAVATPP
jgi:hypothetical protein